MDGESGLHADFWDLVLNKVIEKKNGEQKSSVQHPLSKL